MNLNTGYIREYYLQKILKYLDNTGLIKVFIGQRRVGKSYIMKQIIDLLVRQKDVNPLNIVYVNLEVEYAKYPSIESLDQHIRTHIRENAAPGRTYLFLDEIQEIKGWEKLLNSYRADDGFDVDIYITGSNANLLSSELSTYLA